MTEHLSAYEQMLAKPLEHTELEEDVYIGENITDVPVSMSVTEPRATTNEGFLEALQSEVVQRAIEQIPEEKKGIGITQGVGEVVLFVADRKDQIAQSLKGKKGKVIAATAVATFIAAAATGIVFHEKHKRSRRRAGNTDE